MFPDFSKKFVMDGRLLKMLVERNAHKQNSARDIALNKWLVQESFYDDWLQIFIERFERDDKDAILLESQKTGPIIVNQNISEKKQSRSSGKVAAMG